ncbi:MAG TPA: hypothetical protein VES94_00735 [Burkholderiales bacterium]|nr:hypothetical protein [Burkholderiales bacterium]
MKQIFDYISSFVTIGLMLAGLGGISYNMFKEGGWLGVLFSKFVDVQLENPLFAIPVTIAAVILGKMWHDHQRAKGHTSRMPDIFIYVIMAAGVFYLWRFFYTGSF